MQRTKPTVELSEQVKRKVSKKVVEEEIEAVGNFSRVISTGSTLLDLAISGGRIRGGGLPGGIVVEEAGPAGCGKSTALLEISSNIQEQGGEVAYFDSEGRLSPQFAAEIGIDVNKINYIRANTVKEFFSSIYKFEPQNKDVIHGFFADSLAALSTEMEMESEDKMGMRRAKEFSEHFRKACRIIANNNYLIVCANQVRQNLDAGPYGQKWITPGGQAVPFYASVRLQFHNPEKLKRKKTIAGKEQTRVIGISVEVSIIKNSVWSSWHTAPITFLFGYGIDDIRENLQYIKTNKGSKVYSVSGDSLGNSLEDAIQAVEEGHLHKVLREEVIDLWSEIEEKFEIGRNKKLKF